MPGVESPRHLVIAGTSRAGSTSLFLYMAAHPEIGAAGTKETGFFLDDTYPRLGGHRLVDGPERYGDYFRGCRERPVWLEATPDYLYSPGAAARIRATLPDARLVFILRDPIERLMSWYRFARQLGRLPATLSFADYVELQRSERPIAPGEQQHLRALQHGRYAEYLQVYYTQFSSERLFVTGFSRLAADPRGLLHDLCTFVGLDEAPYGDYQFTPHNPSQPMRSPAINRRYVESRDRLRGRYATSPTVMGLLRPVRRTLEPLLFRLNHGRQPAIELSEQLRRELEAYYAGEREAIADLSSRPDFAW